MAEREPRAYIPHAGWLSHAPADELISLLRQGYFEAAEQAFFWLYLRPGDWFFDCGAHVGLYSSVASRATGGQCHVFALEPSEATARLLESNIAASGLDGARVFRSALWREPGHVSFLDEPPQRSAYSRITFQEQPGSKTVPATTLDELAALSGAQEIALVKLDVEGAEPEALEGARGGLARGVFSVLMIEFTEANLQRRGMSTVQLASRVEGSGYRLCELSRETLQLAPVRVDGPIWFGNLFAVRDLDSVNRRLATADGEHVEVARDILARAAACDRFRELEELDVTRALAESNKQWALNVEELLRKEHELSASLKDWAERTERMLAEERSEHGRGEATRDAGKP
ncbi:MAG TPA: FkbM family methyltransferase [Anaeromyxobacter sp.]